MSTEEKKKTPFRAEDLGLRLAVDGRAWKRVEDFKDSRPDDKHFVMTLDEAGNALISFGDGRHGRRPDAGSEINARWRFGSGTQGNKPKKKRKIRFTLG